MRYFGETENEPQAENNDATFRLPTLTLQNWKDTKEEYLYVHRELENILAKSTQEELEREVRGERTLVLELKSIAMHDAYHIGQIVCLSKMLGGWPGQRDC